MAGIATKVATAVAGLALLVGAYRAIAFGEQSPARGLILFGGIVFAVNASVWIAQRRGEDSH